MRLYKYFFFYLSFLLLFLLLSYSFEKNQKGYTVMSDVGYTHIDQQSTNTFQLHFEEHIWLFFLIFFSIGTIAFLIYKFRSKQIRQREKELEKLIENRTHELQKNNDQLLIEIAERKKMENELSAARIKADSANKSKSEFLANMSHEIRTPMNGILGMIHLLNQSELDETQKEYAQTIHQSGKNLLLIINDVLDFSKIEAGRLDFEEIDFNLKEAIQEIVNLFKYKIKEKHLYFDWSLDDRIPTVINGDPHRLKQIIINLMNNAIKFTRDGSVSLKITPLLNKKAFTRIKFEIKDTGIGIDKKDLDKLFKSFSQVDSNTTRVYGGTGLGLTISKDITQLLGGKIGVESEINKGSTFWFWVDYKTSIAKSIPLQEKIIEQSESQIKNKKSNNISYNILLAEDNMINQKVATMYLKKYGHQVETALNGEIAFEMFTKKEYDFIFMDIQMPVKDGIETTKDIRKYEKQHPEMKPIRIIALTANAMDGDKEVCLAAGMNDFIGKPFKPDELENVLSKPL